MYIFTVFQFCDPFAGDKHSLDGNHTEAVNAWSRQLEAVGGQESNVFVQLTFNLYSVVELSVVFDKSPLHDISRRFHCITFTEKN